MILSCGRFAVVRGVSLCFAIRSSDSPAQLHDSDLVRIAGGVHASRISSPASCSRARAPTVYTVDSLSDTGTGSGATGDLRYCVTQANANPNQAGSVIQFDPSVFSTSSPQTITLSATLDLIGMSGPIEINAPAPGTSDGSGPFAVTVSGGDSVRVFEIGQGVTATISGLSITRGLASGNGGGVWNQGNLTLSNCKVANDTAAIDGGGIENDGTMTASNCLVSDDTAGGSDGGGISNFGVLHLSGSTIDNSEVSGSGGEGGGVFSNDSLTASSIARSAKTR